jgi:hypothetical protein
LIVQTAQETDDRPPGDSVNVINRAQNRTADTLIDLFGTGFIKRRKDATGIK